MSDGTQAPPTSHGLDTAAPGTTGTATVTAAAAETSPRPPSLRGRLHLVGAVLLAASGLPLWSAATTATLRAGVVVYVVGVTAMLATSAAYHVPDWRPATKRVMRRADHSAIFLGVAGTYTPLVLAVMSPRWGALLLATVWAGALGGIVVRNVFQRAPSWARTLPYIVLGWIGVLALPAFWSFAPSVALLVVAGGVAYTLGAVVYARHRPDPWPTTFGYHEVFHALTLIAIALHWAAIHLALTA
jgi:hemolysin III